jgi:hypothetical protein
MYPVPIWAPILSKPDPSLTLDLRFAADGAYFARRGPLPTFTNASTTRTFVGSNGLIQSAGADVPRIEYNPATLECLGLLLEEQRTNLCVQSENVIAANWGKSNVSAFADATTAPTGVVTADVVSETAVSGFHSLTLPSGSVTSGTSYTVSVFLKKSLGSTAPNWVIVALGSQFPSSAVAFNVATGVFGAVSGSSFTYSVEQYQNGWWRVILTATATGTGASQPLSVIFSNNTNTASAPSYLGQTTSDIFVWGAQFEAGAFATSYIPTTTASVQRNADVCSISGANFTSFWNQSEGTLVLEMIKSYTVPVTIAQINYLTASDGTLNNYIQFTQRSAAATGEVFRCEFGGSSQAVFAGGPLNAINTPFRIGGAYKLNDFASAINGSDCSTDTTGTIPTLNKLDFVTVTSANHIRSLQYYNVRKTNTELTRLTRLPTLDPALTLDMQFALDASYFSRLGPLPTFTNASTTRTFVGSDGLIKIAASNVPRIDFDPVTRLCRGLLIEEQRQNVCIWSEDTTQAAWVKTAVTAAANTATAPDGNSSADTLAETIANSQHYIAIPLATITSGTTYTFSCFVKKGSGATAPDWILFSFPFSNFGSRSVAFNVSTGAFGSSLGGTSLAFSVFQFQNGWFRVSLTTAATAGGSPNPAFISFTNNTNTATAPTYTGQTTSDVFIWGAQFEAGAFATSYIPTTTGALTRSADVCSITGAAFTGFYNQTEGSVAIKLVKMATYANNPSYLTIDDNSANNRFSFIHNISGPNEQFSLTTIGATQAAFTTTTLSPLTVGGYAGRYKLNDVAWCASGGAVATDVTANMPTVIQMNIGNRQSGGTMSGWIQAIQYYTNAKTNAQLQALSTP